MHAHEEDVDDAAQYRPQGEPLPPAFGRTAFEIKRNGDFVQHEPGPADAPQRVLGRWTSQGTRQLHVELHDGRSFTLDILALDDQLLTLRRVDVRQATEGVLEAEE